MSHPGSPTQTPTFLATEGDERGSPTALAAVEVPRTPQRRRRLSDDSDSDLPDSPDSFRREIAARRVGTRSLTPYPPPMFSPRVLHGTRSLTPYPDLTRVSPSDDEDSTISSSSDKENEPFVRSSAPSPSPRKKVRRGGCVSQSRSRSNSPSGFVSRVPTNTPRSGFISPTGSESDRSAHEPVTPPTIARVLEERRLEIYIFQRAEEFTGLPLADITAAFVDEEEDAVHDGFICPPNSPVARGNLYY